MERFFTQHSVLRDRDADELGGRVRSDSEASSASSDERNEVSVRSVHDASGPWRQRPVEGGAWGQPGRAGGAAGRKPRDFRAQFTGPKGVLSDYKAHKRSLRDERARKDIERCAVLSRIATGATAPAPTTPGDESGDDADDDCDCDCSDSDCDCGDGRVDAAFLRRYQQRRLQELAAAAAAAPRRPTFGSLRVVSPTEFVAVVDDERADAQRVLLVHLFHPDNYACALLNTHLAAAAQQLPHVQFVAMVAEDADASIARGDLPVLLVYRGRQLDETVVGVARALDGEFTAARVLRFVQERLAGVQSHASATA